MLDNKKKQQIIKKFKIHEEDTGSPQVQIAILTGEVKELAKHLKGHKKDFSSRRGLFRKINQRRKLLEYLAKQDEREYIKLIEKLKIKKKIDIPGITDREENKSEQTQSQINSNQNNTHQNQ